MNLARLWQRDRSGEPVYVVGGFMRSGTTMMMQALERGGLTVDRAPVGNPAREDYELAAEQLRAGWPLGGMHALEVGDALPTGRFPAAHRGHLIKCPVPAARYCDAQPGGFMVVYLHRAPEAIIASQLARWGVANRAEDIAASTARDLNIWRTRDDCAVTLVELEYDAILASPAAAMLKIKAAGFPINVRRAASVVDTRRIHPRQAVAV